MPHELANRIPRHLFRGDYIANLSNLTPSWLGSKRKEKITHQKCFFSSTAIYTHYLLSFLHDDDGLLGENFRSTSSIIICCLQRSACLGITLKMPLIRMYTSEVTIWQKCKLSNCNWKNMRCEEHCRVYNWLNLIWI